jgi:peptide deformylase
MLTLVAHDDPMLKTICRADFIISKDVIEQMFQLMLARNGLGLAAPQVGIDARLFVTRWGEVFINPTIKDRRIPCTVDEGCLSLPGVSRVKQRYHKIVLGDGRVYEAGRAVVIQHELDHLNGTTIIDNEGIEQ